MMTEIFGIECLSWTKEEVKDAIKKLPSALAEKRSYLLKDFASITGMSVTEQDYTDLYN